MKKQSSFKDYISNKEKEYVVTIDADTTNPNSFRTNLGGYTKEEALKQIEKIKATFDGFKNAALQVNPNAKPDVYIRKASDIKLN